MEIMNHLFGTCGELHPNLFTTSMFLIVAYMIYRKYEQKVVK